jgi:hypothetical protein
MLEVYREEANAFQKVAIRDDSEMRSIMIDEHTATSSGRKD